jgi:3-methyladenine DNA glycosylase AlkD
LSKEYSKHLKEVLSRIEITHTVIPAHRAAFKKGYSFSKEPFEDQLPIWNHVWKHSGDHRAQMHAYFFLEQYVSKMEYHVAIWDTSVAWQHLVKDWSLCDALAKINTKVLETFPIDVYQQLNIWNKDEDLWKRRQSVVSLLYFSRTKKVYLPFKKIAALVEPLLTDKEYYVQKGVGWALREVHTVYPEATLPFLKKHIKNISPIAFTIAIEKMDDDEKKMLKAIRK